MQAGIHHGRHFGGIQLIPQKHIDLFDERLRVLQHLVIVHVQPLRRWAAG